MGCKKAQGFLESNAAGPAAEVVDATKQRFGRDDALKLAKAADRVVTGKGGKVVVFDMKAPPDDDTLAAALLGPSGNLKAPTLRVGRTLLVGFSEAAYRQVFA
ncbi:MAG TPA: ArsC family (seleno)protein [Gemmataceae bacterium]|nr:ArsC family (seleno)protein [Gemmataceae bacterium]